MGLHWDMPRVRFAAVVILLVAFVYLLFLIAPLIWSVIEVAIILLFVVLALNPLVNYLVAFGSPRWAAVFFVILLLLLLIVLLIWFLIPPLAAQVEEFISNLPGFWAEYQHRINAFVTRNPELGKLININQLPANLLSGFRSFPALARTIFTTTLGVLATIVLIIVATVYTLLYPWPLLLGLRGLFPTEWWDTIDRLATSIAQKIQGWVLGTIALGILIALLDYIALLLINLFSVQNIPFILLFAVIGGVLEFLPVIGPSIAVILPALVALAIDPYMALAVVLAYLTIQQIENHIAVPLIMHKAVSLHPVSLIFALIFMAGLFGVFGAIIAVPAAATLKVIYDEWYYPIAHHDEHPLPSPTVREEALHTRRMMRERWQAWRERRHRHRAT